MAAILPLKIVTVTSIVEAVPGSADYVHPALRSAGGATILVDKVFGSDAFGARQGHAFATITAALAAAVAGDLVLVGPGAYDESITIPANVGVRGAQVSAVTIQRLLVVANTDLVAMGENSRLEDVSLLLTSAGHFALRGVVFSGTTAATAKLRRVNVVLDNSTAGGVGSSNVFGVHSSGTGSPSATQALQSVSIVVASAGLGAKLGILCDTAAHTFRARDTDVLVVNAGGAGAYFGVGVDFAGAVFQGRGMSITAPTADLAPLAGKASIQIDQSVLGNSTSYGQSFTSLQLRPPVVFADNGALLGGVTRFMRPGTGPVSTVETKIRFSRPTIVQALTVRAATAPGAARTDIFTARKNGVDTTLTASLTAAATLVQDNANAVSFAAGDDLSFKVVTAVATGTSDVVVTMETY
jgi:hypothetical protein